MNRKHVTLTDDLTTGQTMVDVVLKRDRAEEKRVMPFNKDLMEHHARVMIKAFAAPGEASKENPRVGISAYPEDFVKLVLFSDAVEDIVWTGVGVDSTPTATTMMASYYG